jgi:hypothetical protein
MTARLDYVFALYDTASAVTRICGDLIGIDDLEESTRNRRAPRYAESRWIDTFHYVPEKRNKKLD